MRSFFSALWSAGAAATQAVVSVLKTHWVATIGVVLFGIYLLVDKNIFIPRTEGTIFIETPQIYTRERLVNDRFVQESWLRDVLKVDPKFSPTSIVSTTDQKSRVIGAGGAEPPKAPDSQNTQSGGTAPGGAQLQIHPAIDFLLRNSYRELIRGHLIENQLDDRHDSRGTTIYLLKFDAAIIPGNNTRKRAFVQVRMTRDAAVKIVKPADQPAKTAQTGRNTPAQSTGGGCAEEAGKTTQRPNKAQLYFQYYIEHVCLFLGYSSADDYPILLEFDLYNQWIVSLEDRLNTALREFLLRFDSNRFRVSEYYEFLSMLAENGPPDWFPRWAIGLSQLEHQRDRIRNDINRASPTNSTTDSPSLAALEHQFNFLAKSVLIDAVEGKAADFDKLEKMLGKAAPLPPPGDDSRLRDALHRYAVRRIGIAVVGDTSFQLEKLQPTASVNTIRIRSKTLDRFVTMQLQTSTGGQTPQPAADGQAPQLAADGRTSPKILLIPRDFALYAFKKEEVDNKKDDCATKFDDQYEYLTSYETAGDREQFGVYVQKNAAPDSDATLVPAYILNPKNLESALREAKFNLNIFPLTCFPSARGRSLPIGFLNFVKNVLDTQTYTYATLPRIDLLVSDASTDSAQSEGLSANVPGAGASGAISNSYRRIERALESKASVVGFSGSNCSRPGSLPCGAPPPADELNFGWVFSPPGDVTAYPPMQPTQRSLSALITVPTWWKQAHLEITTGWVRPDGSFDARLPQNYRIPLPIDFESLDAILTEPGRRDSRRPSIALERMPENLQVQACDRAEILVPGHRLWRSSVVVLDGQRADEVSVLPDMRGIIATFKKVAPRRSWETDDNAVRKLQVWTSEGVAQEIAVKINRASSDCTADQAAAPDNPKPTR